MSEAQKLREEFDKKLKELQDSCPHKESQWMNYMWAPGHSTGEKVLVCKRCEKIIDRKVPELESAGNSEWKTVGFVRYITD